MTTNPITRCIVLGLLALIMTGCPATTIIKSDEQPGTVSDSRREAEQQSHHLELKSLQARAQNSSRKQAVANELAHTGLTLFGKGYYLDAIDYFNAAAEIQEQAGDDAGRAHNLNNLARLYTLVGDQDQARKRVDAALSIAEQLDSLPLQASSLINLGNLELNLRNYQQADKALQRAIHLSKQASRDDLRAEALIVFGAVYRQQGDFEQALSLYQESLSIYKRLKRDNEAAMTLRVLGELYLHRVEGDRKKNLEQAKKLLDQALEKHKRFGDHLGEAMTVSHLGEHAYETQNYADAIKHYQAAQAYFEASGFLDGAGRMYIHLGFALGDSGQLPQAIESFNKAIVIYLELKDREWQRVALFGRGLNQQKSGESVAAEKSYREAVDIFESIRSDVVGGEAAQTLFTQVNRELYERLVELLLDKGDVEAALEYVERSRLRALRDNLLNTRVSAQTRDANGIDALKGLSVERAFVREKMLTAQDPVVRERLTETLALNDLEANKVVFKLSQRYRGIEHTLDVVPNTRSFRHSDIFPDDLAIITYFATAEALYVFVVKKGSDVVVEKIAITGEELADKVANAILMIGSNKDKPFKSTASDDNALADVLADLYEVLIAPIDNRLVGINNLAVLPVKWLNYLPFEALVKRGSDGGWQFLQQSRQVVYLSSHTYADQAFSLVNPETAPATADIVAFGNPDLGDPDYALPFAAEEVKEIGRLFPGTVVFVGEEATKTNFTAHWGRHEIVHIAAHAQLLDGQAQILLAPGKSGTMAIEELFDLSPNETTSFVVLSACQTAIDPDLTRITWQPKVGGDGIPVSASGPVASAAHTLLLVGIPAVTATLWKIDDQATALLMGEFYSQLKENHDIYTAFRQAQLKMMQRQDLYSQPYYWAAFVYYGLER